MNWADAAASAGRSFAVMRVARPLTRSIRKAEPSSSTLRRMKNSCSVTCKRMMARMQECRQSQWWNLRGLLRTCLRAMNKHSERWCCWRLDLCRFGPKIMRFRVWSGVIACVLLVCLGQTHAALHRSAASIRNRRKLSSAFVVMTAPYMLDGRLSHPDLTRLKQKRQHLRHQHGAIRTVVATGVAIARVRIRVR